MSDEILPAEKPVEQPVPSAPVLTPSPNAIIAVAPKKQDFHPFAFSCGIKLKETAIKLVREFVHEKANPLALKIAKDAALAHLESFPDDVTGAEVKIDGNGLGTQTNVIVIPHKL